MAQTDVIKLFASLNILYLKLFQYEKYVDSGIITDLFDCVNQWLDDLKKKYDQDCHLTELDLETLFDVSQIDIYFEHSTCADLVYEQLSEDLDRLKPEMVLKLHIV